MVVLGLGSNLGDRLNFLSQAVCMLGDVINNVKISSIYESEAILPPNAPTEWDNKYLNMVITGETKESPEKLLKTIKKIESKLGRPPEHETWSPREIDIDILAYGSKNITFDELIIPHKQLLYRDFTILPMVEIFPEWIYPGPGKYNSKTIKYIAEDKFSYPNLPQTLKKTDLCLK